MSDSGIQFTGEKPAQAFGEAAAQPRKTGKKLPPPFSIRFTDEERARLNREAGKLSLSAHIRRKLFGEAETPRRTRSRKIRQPSLDHTKLGQALGILGQSRLAANMNQIAKAANMGALPVSEELSQELHEACADLREMRHALIAALGIKPEDGS